MLPKGVNDESSQMLRGYVLGADLDNAWRGCAGSREDGSKIHIVGEHEVPVVMCPLEHHRVRRSTITNGRPVDSGKTMALEHRYP